MSDREAEIESLSIPEKEKQNVKELMALMEKSANDLQHRIVLEIVGGAVTKEWPRKDIDLACHIVDLGDVEGEHPLERSNRFFSVLEDIVHDAVEKSGGFAIVNTTHPYVDHQQGGEDIMEHNGSIIVKPIPKGTPIEVINNV
ncbi:MAG: hypothetical protein ABSC49_02545 [Candidatus Microgenomates bacterium]|jgi:hypothetical protein